MRRSRRKTTTELAHGLGNEQWYPTRFEVFSEGEVAERRGPGRTQAWSKKIPPQGPRPTRSNGNGHRGKAQEEGSETAEHIVGGVNHTTMRRIWRRGKATQPPLLQHRMPAAGRMLSGSAIRDDEITK